MLFFPFHSPFYSFLSFFLSCVFLVPSLCVLTVDSIGDRVYVRIRASRTKVQMTEAFRKSLVGQGFRFLTIMQFERIKPSYMIYFAVYHLADNWLGVRLSIHVAHSDPKKKKWRIKKERKIKRKIESGEVKDLYRTRS